VRGDGRERRARTRREREGRDDRGGDRGRPRGDRG
jgi:hypothetical protein